MKLKVGPLLTWAVAALLVAAANCHAQAVKTYRIGIMVNGSSRAFLDRFRDDLAKLGYTGDKRVVIEGKFAEGQIDRLPALAQELAVSGVDVILALGGPAARAAKNATSQIPIVFSVVTDPVALGLVESMERPGANVTGVTSLDREQAAKQFQLLKDVFPNLKRVAILSDDTIPGADARGLAPIDRANESAARALGIEPLFIKLKGAPATDLNGAFAQMVQERLEAVLVLETPVPFAHQKRIGELAIANKLPAVSPCGQADAGGVVTYGTSISETWPRMSGQADKILRGAKPAEMPVEMITRRDLVINLATAPKIGVSVPPEILRQADRIVD
jgi:putative ABC transport system substrate-binding protein